MQIEVGELWHVSANIGMTGPRPWNLGAPKIICELFKDDFLMILGGNPYNYGLVKVLKMNKQGSEIVRLIWQDFRASLDKMPT